MAAVLASLAACELLAGIDDDHFTVAPIADASPGADAPPASVDLCAHARPPAPPGPTDAGSPGTYVFAVDDFSFEATDGGVPVGFDLDKACTCFDGGATTHDAEPSCAPRENATACDDLGGVDNSFATLFRQISALASGFDVEEAMRKNTRCGRQAIIFVLRDYNGTAEDEEVLVGPMISDGIRETLDGGPGIVGQGCSPSGATAASAFAPTWDGTDLWSHPPDAIESISTRDDPRPLVLLSGYVSRFRLVISYDDDQHKLPFPFAGARVGLGTPVLVAQLVPLDDQGLVIPLGADGNPAAPASAFAMTGGVVSGRAKADDFVAAIGKVSYTQLADGGDVFACTNPAFPLVRQLVCSSVDIQALGRNDFQARPCDAFSIAVQFSARPAKLGGEYTFTPTSPTGCEPDFGVCPP